MKISINGSFSALVEDETLIQNSKKTYTVNFVFDSSWDGFVKTVLFEAGEASVMVVLSEDRCSIPAECLKRGGVLLKIGIYGSKGDAHKATVWCLASRILYATDLDIGSGSTYPPMPDDLYNEIMAAIGDLGAAGFEGKSLAEAMTEMKNSISTTATDEEVQDILDSTFGSSSVQPDDPDVEDPANTATDKEVADILDEVFGKGP